MSVYLYTKRGRKIYIPLRQHSSKKVVISADILSSVPTHWLPDRGRVDSLLHKPSRLRNLKLGVDDKFWEVGISRRNIKNAGIGEDRKGTNEDPNGSQMFFICCLISSTSQEG